MPEYDLLTKGVRGDDHPVAWPLYNSKEPEQTKRDRYVHREPTDL